MAPDPACRPPATMAKYCGETAPRELRELVESGGTKESGVLLRVSVKRPDVAAVVIFAASQGWNPAGHASR